jgi:predicted ABC-type ATPase
MNCLSDAIKLVDRAYIFDNSFKKPKLFATSQNEEISLLTDYVPAWFDRYVIKKRN